MCCQTIYLFPLYHCLVPYDKYNDIEQIYFNNGNYMFIFHPLENNYPLYQNTLFFFNHTAGNCSSHYAIVRLLQKIYPTFTIVQIEYSGFGHSYESKLLFDQIVHFAKTCIDYVLNEKGQQIQKCIYFGYKLGGYICSLVLKKIQNNEYFLPPDSFVLFDSILYFNEQFEEKISFPFQGICCFLLKNNSLVDILKEYKKELSLHVIETDNNKLGKSIVFPLENINRFSVHSLYLKDSGKFCILFEKNFEKIQAFLKSSCKREHFVRLFTY